MGENGFYGDQPWVDFIETQKYVCLSLGPSLHDSKRVTGTKEDDFNALIKEARLPSRYQRNVDVMTQNHPCWAWQIHGN